jgi:hypothetical protein
MHVAGRSFDDFHGVLVVGCALALLPALLLTRSLKVARTVSEPTA